MEYKLIDLVVFVKGYSKNLTNAKLYEPALFEIFSELLSNKVLCNLAFFFFNSSLIISK